MSRVFVHGVGAVSPAGWGVAALRSTLEEKKILPIQELARPGGSAPLRVLRVPAPQSRAPSFSHPRLRRASPIALFAASAALEALGADKSLVNDGSLRLGIVLCALTGCLNYCRRFYDETLSDPATASPLIFAETVFNAPASHLAALLGTAAISYTLVGDPGTFLQGTALAANWLAAGRVDGCLVLGAEEMDWLTVDAHRRFVRSVVVSEGAGALYLRREPAEALPVELISITDAHLFFDHRTRLQAASKVRTQLADACSNDLLCDSRQELVRPDAPETEAWKDWPGLRLSPKKILGEGLMAAAAWQCVVAADAIVQGPINSATVSVTGCNELAIGAKFARVAGQFKSTN